MLHTTEKHFTFPSEDKLIGKLLKHLSSLYSYLKRNTKKLNSSILSQMVIINKKETLKRLKKRKKKMQEKNVNENSVLI